MLRKIRWHYGPVARITTGFGISTLGGVAYCVLTYYAYKLSPCGHYGASAPKCVDNGLVADISLWWIGLPYGLGGFSELFINVPGMTLSLFPIPHGRLHGKRNLTYFQHTVLPTRERQPT